MSENPFVKFVEFVECERNLLNIELQRQKLQNNIKQIEESIAREKGNLAAVTSKVSQLQKQVHEYELEGRAKREREREIKKRLDEISSPKEYTSYQKELAELESSGQSVEDKLFQTWQELETIQAEYKEKKDNFQEWLSKQEQVIAQNKKSYQELGQSIHEIQERCAKLATNVNPELLEKINSMKLAVNNPAVPVIDAHCSACNFQLPAKDMALIAKQAIVNCASCYRMLYLNPVSKHD